MTTDKKVKVKSFIPEEEEIQIKNNAAQIFLYSLCLLTVLGLNDLAKNMLVQYGGKIVKNQAIYVTFLLVLTLGIAFWLDKKINLV